ncbi:MAG: hypothetical protein IKL59_00510 [Clostridia bacterium]|nr:hypothetical protein [Clostridia bacterium]
MNQEKLRVLLIVLSCVFAALFVGLLIFGILFDADFVVTKILVIALSVVSLALAGEFLFLYILFKDTKPNFFLYDTKIKGNVSVDKLSFATINTRMNSYFSNFASSEGKIWTEGILDDPDLDMSDVFKPIVAYKLLLDLAVMDKEIGWKCFEMASNETVMFICNSLENNNDAEFAAMVREYKAAVPANTYALRELLVGNKSYLKKKIYKYVCANIESFNDMQLS